MKALIRLRMRSLIWAFAARKCLDNTFSRDEAQIKTALE